MIVPKIKHFLRNSRQYLFCRNNSIDIYKYRYFIFLDSKVPNIIEQIHPYFQKGFFDKEQVVIVYRHHFDNIKPITKALAKFGLKSYCFINLRDIPALQDVVWFYTHNSMTNLAVINKNVYSKHIWMGHGDSEKVSSYKKIIRIYDYCLVAGENSIERFYTHHIFRREEGYRFIRTGRANLCSVIPTQPQKSRKQAVLFAPTWEGPMREENYATLHLHQETVEIIDTLLSHLGIQEVVMKFHPNTGVRDTEYLLYSYRIVTSLLEKRRKLTLITEKGSWIERHFSRKFGESLLYKESLFDLQEYSFVRAITNISAMATMSYAEGINTLILYDSRMEIQKNINFLFTKKFALDKIPLDKTQYLTTPMSQNSKVISYEKGWDGLSQKEIFKCVIKHISKR
jgi:hypothetical protein